MNLVESVKQGFKTLRKKKVIEADYLITIVNACI